MQQYYKAYMRNHRNAGEEEEMSSILKLLLSADEPVPIEGHYDIREALKKAQGRYIAKKTAEFMPYAYEEYKLNRSMNFGASEDALKQVEDYQSIRKLYYDNIINGRILNGEPGDLNF